MPETVPRWLLVGAGIVALLIVLVEVKDFAERKNASSPPPGASSSTAVSPDAKSSPKKAVKTNEHKSLRTQQLIPRPKAMPILSKALRLWEGSSKPASAPQL